MSRLQKINRFTSIPNDLLNDESITFRAKGVWAFINSKPEGWEFSRERIAAQTKEGEKAVRTALQELEEAGYLKRILRKSENGQLHGYDYIITDKAHEYGDLSVGLKTTDGFSTDGKQADIVIKKQQERNSNTTTKQKGDSFLYEVYEEQIEPTLDPVESTDLTEEEIRDEIFNHPAIDLAKPRDFPDAKVQDFTIEAEKYKAYCQSNSLKPHAVGFCNWMTRWQLNLKKVQKEAHSHLLKPQGVSPGNSPGRYAGIGVKLGIDMKPINQNL